MRENHMVHFNIRLYVETYDRARLLRRHKILRHFMCFRKWFKDAQSIKAIKDVVQHKGLIRNKHKTCIFHVPTACTIHQNKTVCFNSFYCCTFEYQSSNEYSSLILFDCFRLILKQLSITTLLFFPFNKIINRFKCNCFWIPIIVHFISISKIVVSAN